MTALGPIHVMLIKSAGCLAHALCVHHASSASVLDGASHALAAAARTPACGAMLCVSGCGKTTAMWCTMHRLWPRPVPGHGQAVHRHCCSAHCCRWVLRCRTSCTLHLLRCRTSCTLHLLRCRTSCMLHLLRCRTSYTLHLLRCRTSCTLHLHCAHRPSHRPSVM